MKAGLIDDERKSHELEIDGGDVGNAVRDAGSTVGDVGSAVGDGESAVGHGESE